MLEVMLGAVTEIAPTRLDHPMLAAVHAYWSAKRGDRPMPARADMDPLELRDYLGWIAILDVLEDGSDFHYRLVGTKVVHYFGGDGTGKTISETFGDQGPDIVGGVIGTYRRAALKCLPVRVHSDVPWREGNRGVFDSIHLPLSDDGVTANMVMSVFTFDYREITGDDALFL